MHGVGQKPIMRALHEIGVRPDCIFSVVEQQDPDPDFPTVSFPNPEEHGTYFSAFSYRSAELTQVFRCFGMQSHLYRAVQRTLHESGRT
jgi:phosphomannomutase